MSAMVELAERVEKATGPDRELDCAIAVALDRTDEGGSGFHRVFADDSVFEQVRALQFTASLDAAMTLVPEGYARRVDYRPGHLQDMPGSGPKAALGMLYKNIGEDVHIAYADTEPLALCAAALRAQAGADQ